MDVEAFCGMGNGQYLGLEFYPSEDEAAQYRLIWLTPAEGDFSEKRLIRIAGSRSGIFSMAARDFTSLYPEYQVEFVDYEAQYGEQADQQLFMDLLYGDCPDLLFVNGLPFAQYARQGLLEELYAWMTRTKRFRARTSHKIFCTHWKQVAHCTACRRPICLQRLPVCQRSSAAGRAGP